MHTFDQLTPAGDADEQDYRPPMHPDAIGSGTESATIKLTALEDQDLGVDSRDACARRRRDRQRHGRRQEPR